MTFLYKNNAISRLKVAIDPATVSFPVLDGEGAKFPEITTPGDYFLITLDDRRSGQVEICKCTARTGDMLTVVRAQEGTTAQAFLANATVANRFTAGTLDLILSTSGYTKPEADAKFVDVAGDTMAGPLVLSGAPGAGNQATNKTYVDAQVATRTPEAPSDGQTYGRRNAVWTAVVRTVDYTAADVLAKLLTVDGAGTGLDADLLDGQQGAYYATQANHLDLTTRVTDAESDIAALDTRVTANETVDTSQDSDIADLQATKADLASPTFTGDPKAPTPTPGDSDTSIATTAFVANAVSGFAPLASPTFTGDPKAPTPATADNDTSIATTAYVKANLAALPPSGIPEAPNDGTQYVRQSLGWSPVDVPPGTYIGDTPPGAPDVGQLWWQSSTGLLFIWFNDGSSSQWVQVGIGGPTTQPAQQTFYPSGVISFVIPVPATAKRAVLRGSVLASTTAGMGPVIRLSLDGSTFLSGASDYVWGGNTLYTGTAGNPTKSAPIGATYFNLAGYTNRADTHLFFDTDLVVNRPAGALFSFRSRAWGYHDAASAGFQDALYAGYNVGANWGSATQIAAIQIINSVSVAQFAPGSVVTVDWSY